MGRNTQGFILSPSHNMISRFGNRQHAAEVSSAVTVRCVCLRCLGYEQFSVTVAGKESCIGCTGRSQTQGVLLECQLNAFEFLWMILLSETSPQMLTQIGPLSPKADMLQWGHSTVRDSAGYNYLSYAQYFLSVKVRIVQIHSATEFRVCISKSKHDMWQKGYQEDANW